MTKEDFIKKWNVGYEDKEQKIEFAKEMRNDLIEIKDKKIIELQKILEAQNEEAVEILVDKALKQNEILSLQSQLNSANEKLKEISQKWVECDNDVDFSINYRNKLIN